MPPHTAAPCPHELRPGTAVCLRCQHAERAAARSRQRHLIARTGAAVFGVAAMAAAGIAGATALRGRGADGGPTPTRGGTAAVDSSAPRSAIVTATPAPLRADTAVGALASAPLPAAVVPPARAWVAPAVREGRTDLRDTLFAVRAGDTVRVYFDRAMTRTRRADKFEGIVRTTLPQVFGAIADTALSSMPAGAVAQAGDLVAELPGRGLRLALPDGRAISVWPETRPGRDGPLIASYRAVATR